MLRTECTSQNQCHPQTLPINSTIHQKWTELPESELPPPRAPDRKLQPWSSTDKPIRFAILVRGAVENAHSDSHRLSLVSGVDGAALWTLSSIQEGLLSGIADHDILQLGIHSKATDADFGVVADLVAVLVVDVAHGPVFYVYVAVEGDLWSLVCGICASAAYLQVQSCSFDAMLHHGE